MATSTGILEVERAGDTLIVTPTANIGGRPLQPHRVAVAQPEIGEEPGKGVADQRGVDVPEVARPDKDSHAQQPGNQQAPAEGFAVPAPHANILTRRHRRGQGHPPRPFAKRASVLGAQVLVASLLD